MGFLKKKRKMNFSYKLAICLLALLAMITACGEENDTSSSSETGEVVIGLTDAQGDFITYTVDVTSLSLTMANGAIVEALPVSTSVDFAQYTDMTEFLTVATIPTGLYESGTMTLDFSNADIQVEGANGDAVAVQTIQDESGSAITTLELAVKLEDVNALVIATGIPAHLTLDFNLNATNSVDFGTGLPVLTVQPTLVAEVNPEAPKIHRARGALKSVDVSDASFRIIIRPFIHAISGGDEKFGTLQITTTSSTVFDLNGSIYEGNDGIQEMDLLQNLTGIIAVGDLKFNPTRFEASQVFAGSSVPGGDMDVVAGNVTDRTGNVFTVKGATLIRTDGSVVFNDQVTVTLDENTSVSRQKSTDEYTIDDISVGQRVVIFGTLTNTQATNLELDATSGHARMEFTTLRGTFISTSPFNVDLQAIDGRRISLFDFSGTGQTEDADPNNYEIDTGTLDISTIDIGAVVKIRGFVEPFGTVDSPDFEAQTIIDLSKVVADLAVGWFPPVVSAFSNITESSITLDLTGTGLFHHVSRQGLITDLKQLGSDFTIQSQQSGNGIFFIRESGTWQLYTAFASCVSDIEERLNDSKLIRFITARGTFDQNAATLTVKSMTVTMK